ncbi:MAG: hypothetical protein KQH63_07095 [Desulfobulbaceae bacterium]|nr:hypothetical protein [Desulfobulbaceae bacterium]
MSMHGNTRNFDTLIVAGVGTIGGSMIELGGGSVLPLFKKVILVDLDLSRLSGYMSSGFTCLHGSLEDAFLIQRIIQEMEGKGLIVNLCADTDNVRIRQMIAPFDLAYVDSCAGSVPDMEDCCFSTLMDYTLTSVPSRCPQWLCWGINPGMVEIIARKIIRDRSWNKGKLSVTVFENDQLEAKLFNGKIALGWCPSAFIEELMLFPTMEVINGKPREDSCAGARGAIAYWAGKPVPSRIVAHEDIWNMSMIEGVEEARFLYGLHPKVMHILDSTPQAAERVLQVPPENIPVGGLEQVAVRVNAAAKGHSQTLLWKTDHQQTWETHGLNAVQFQTATSMLLAVMLLQQTGYGILPGNFCAANLPILSKDWQQIERFMSLLGMEWEDGDHLNLSFQRL